MSSSAPSPTSTPTTVPNTPAGQPTASSGNNGNGGGSAIAGGTGSSLYLFTFLATLFLLLFVSCAIVLRSFLLRRRFRRRIEEAIAAGAALPPMPGHSGRRRRDFGEKPKLWDLWVADGGDTWNGSQPLAVRKVGKRFARQSSSTPTPSQSPAPVSAFGRFRQLIHRSRRGTDSATPTSPGASTPMPVAELEDGAEEARKKVQVSVLIAMPSPQPCNKGTARSLRSDDGEEQFPDVAIGVADVLYRKDAL